MLQYTKLQTRPAVICLSASADATFLEAAGAPTPGPAPGCGSDYGEGGFDVQLERSASFVYDKVGLYRPTLCQGCWAFGWQAISPASSRALNTSTC